MPLTPYSLSLGALRAWIDKRSWALGEKYARQGHVMDLRVEERVLYAQVQGSELQPYRVYTTCNDEGHPVEATCTCPAYTRLGRYCKHIAAAAIACQTGQVRVESEAPLIQLPLAKLLEHLPPEETRDILAQLAFHEPALDDLLRFHLLAHDPERWASPRLFRRAVQTWSVYVTEQHSMVPLL